MKNSLDQYQIELESHFQELSHLKKQRNIPLFVLEHGLSSDQLAYIAELLNAELNRLGLLANHWLLWIIYAAEQGYAYQGEEYWYSFERSMPGWRANGSRHQIRTWFRRFASQYSGASPQGTWASHFSIIAWPITHAILPRDLQGCLAHTLFKARYPLAQTSSLNPVEIGQLVAKYVHHPSSRFDYFLQHPEFVGHIVSALLNNDLNDNIIFPSALFRIITDLESVRSANEWMKDARKIFVAPHFKTSFQRTSSSFQLENVHQEEPIKLNLFNVRPAISVFKSTNQLWKFTISFPSFYPLFESDSSIATFLQKVRIKIPYSSDTWLPAGWLFTGLRQRALSKWPEANIPLIETHSINPQLQDLLDRDCLIQNEVNWVFKIHSDGSGSYLMSRALSPDNTYLIISRQPFKESQLYIPALLDCEGIFGVILDLPSQLLTAHEECLTNFNLTCSRTIRIEPIGKLPRHWTEDLTGEWLSTETPHFRIEHNTLVSEYCFTLNDTTPVVISPDSSNSSFFIKLDTLAPGVHKLNVVAKLPNNIQLIGDITLNVKHPTSWQPEHQSSLGLFVDVSPSEPTLDDFLRDQIDIEVHGPKSYPVKCSITLLNGLSEIVHTVNLFEQLLPVTVDIWEKALHNFINSDWDSIKFLAAKSGLLIFENPELGQYKVKLNRIMSPLRWIYRNHNHKYNLALIDDNEANSVQICFYDFETPLSHQTIEVSTAANGFEINAHGGLFTANSHSNFAALVLSPSLTAKGLNNLFTINKESLQKHSDKKTLLELYTTWMKSSCAGPLSNIKRNKAAEAIKERLLELLCGKRWVHLEHILQKSPENRKTWDSLEEEICSRSNFGIAIGHRWSEGSTQSIEETIREFSMLAKKFQICKNAAICEAACRIILEMQSFTDWANGSIDLKLEELAYYSSLLRGVRLIELNKIQLEN